MFTPKLETAEISLTIPLDDVEIVPSLSIKDNNNSETKSLNEVEKMIDSLGLKIDELDKSYHKKLFDEIIELTGETQLRIEEIQSILLYDKWELDNGYIVYKNNFDLWCEEVNAYKEENGRSTYDYDIYNEYDVIEAFDYMGYSLINESDNFFYIK